MIASSLQMILKKSSEECFSREIQLSLKNMDHLSNSLEKNKIHMSSTLCISLKLDIDFLIVMMLEIRLTKTPSPRENLLMINLR